MEREEVKSSSQVAGSRRADHLRALWQSIPCRANLMIGRLGDRHTAEDEDKDKDEESEDNKDEDEDEDEQSTGLRVEHGKWKMSSHLRMEAHRSSRCDR
eukprot:208572-Hanusia_phi.AAC.1